MLHASLTVSFREYYSAEALAMQKKHEERVVIGIERVSSRVIII